MELKPPVSPHFDTSFVVKFQKQPLSFSDSIIISPGRRRPVKGWWKETTFQSLLITPWVKDSLRLWQPVLLLVEGQIRQLTLQLEAAATGKQARGLGALSSVVIDREVGS